MTVNEDAIAEVRSKVEAFCTENAYHIEEADDEYTEHTDTLCRLGVTPDNAYIFTIGHKVLDSLVVPMLKKLIRERQGKDKSWVRDNFQIMQSETEQSKYLTTTKPTVMLIL